jgi:hypothetical protein
VAEKLDRANRHQLSLAIHERQTKPSFCSGLWFRYILFVLARRCAARIYRSCVSYPSVLDLSTNAERSRVFSTRPIYVISSVTVSAAY